MKKGIVQLGKWGLRIFLLVLVGMCLFFALRPEGEFVPPPADLSDKREKLWDIKILTWNILNSEKVITGGTWEERKHSLEIILSKKKFDILCFQEALPDQIQFFEKLLPDYNYYGVGREDGKSKGEHGPIFYNRTRFKLIDSNTFWLSPTPEIPSKGWGELFPRMCSWVELEELSSSQRFRVYNIHLQLHPYAQIKASELIASRVEKVDLPIVVLGDMNCPPEWSAIKKLESIGLSRAETSGALTYHIGGKAIRCLDHLLVSTHWKVTDGGVIKEKGGDVFPSDHFGLWASLEMMRNVK